MIKHTLRRFSSASNTSSVYKPPRALNFKKNGFNVYEAFEAKGAKTLSWTKLAHTALLSLSIYSLVQAYRKRRIFRGVFFWTPITFILFNLSSAIHFRFRYINRI